jgi:hypothetical protein
VRANRFYVIPDPWILESVGIRLTDVIELREPSDPS